MSAEDYSGHSICGTALDAEGRLAEDRRCGRCGYNLHGLAPEHECPECALPVWRSLLLDSLRYADRRWLRTVRGGLLLLFVAVGLVGVSAFRLMAASLAGRPVMTLGGLAGDVFALLVCLGGSAVGLVGMLLFTTPEPGEWAGWPVLARRWARGLMWALAVLGGATVLFIVPSFMPAPWRSGVSSVFVVADVVVGLALAFAGSLYMGSLHERSLAGGGDLAMLGIVNVLALGALLLWWFVTHSLSSSALVGGGVFTNSAIPVVGIAPVALVVLLLLVWRTHGVVDQACEDGPDHCPRMPPPE
ncbi:MAG: hypothetical protein PVJ57_05130 [Phycisphaerae bacterium]|jgi:hypothetical protein